MSPSDIHRDEIFKTVSDDDGFNLTFLGYKSAGAENMFINLCS